MSSDEFIAAMVGNALAGFVVWVITAVLLWCGGVVRARRARRREIIALVNRAHAVAFSAINEGLYDQAWITASLEPLRDAKTRYDELTAHALNLFTPRESEVAFWCAVELYAGWLAPGDELRQRGVPRAESPDGRPLVSNDDLGRGWVLARAEVLKDWANVCWPWDVGNARGPQYAIRQGHGYTAGDRSRHRIVLPNTDVNGDMLRAYANLVRRPSWKATGRRARELERKFPDGELAQ